MVPAMSLYTQFGNEVYIVKDAGTHDVKRGKHWIPLRLVLVEDEHGKLRYEFAEVLRADGGYKNIIAAADVAEKISLTGPELSAALREAE